MLRAAQLARWPRHRFSANRNTNATIVSIATVRRTLRLANDAESNPTNTQIQSAFLKELNRVNPEAVVRRVESQRYGIDDEVRKEYLKALASTNRLQTSDLQGLLGSSPFTQGTHTSQTSPSSTNASSSEPLRLQMTRPTFREEVWATIKTFGITFLLISGLSYVLELMQPSQNRMNAMDQTYTPTTQSTKRFEDVKGCDEAVSELREVVAYLKDPASFTRLGGKLPKGVLLTGPPGTGKTLLARAVAGEAGVPFFYASGSEFEEVFVGVGARRIRSIFAAAKAQSPCIVFIDEIDAVGGRRNPRDSHSSKMTLNQLLVEMDGFESAQGVIVIAATNFPDLLDNALVRPGRFDRRVVVQPPDIRGREQILTLYLSKVALQPGSLAKAANTIARGTTGMTGAELENLVNTASIRATTQGRPHVTLDDLEFAREKIIMGPQKASFRTTEKARECTAHHEAGHALLAALTPAAHPIYKATILPRGQALGMVQMLPKEDTYGYTKELMLAQMDVCMGGRIGEELLLGSQDFTSGASADFESATNIARMMVMQWGMSEAVGPMFISEEELGNVGERTRRLIDSEVNRLLEESYTRSKNLIVKHRAQHLAIAKALLEKETLDGDDILALVKGPGVSEVAASASPKGNATSSSKPPDKSALDGASTDVAPAAS